MKELVMELLLTTVAGFGGTFIGVGIGLSPCKPGELLDSTRVETLDRSLR